MMRNVKQPQLLSLFRRHCLAISFPSSRYITTTSKSTIHINAEVQEAIRNRKPVVALESTIITHGMPYPKNLDMANLVEQMIRHHGAIPATIAVINGVFKIGLTASELQQLAKPYDSILDRDKKKLKISRKDLAYAHASKSDGGATVAATMILAHKAGIKFFATGGIGGVHRGAEITMDVSTDLTELSKTPVVVVCAGIKSILDIPKTLEVLETHGVPVVTLDSPTFPAFFTNDSGITSPLSIQDIDTIAEMAFTSKHILQLNNGMIAAVPNPDPADSVAIQNAIDQALKEANDVSNNITGNRITPFLLARIEQLTQGKSLTSNIALVLNNAKIAAQLAVSYQQQVIAYTGAESSNSNTVESKEESLLLSPSSSSSSSSTNSTQPSDTAASTTTTTTTTSINNKYIQPVPVLIFGGCVMDIIAKSSQPTFIPGSSNPGVVKFSYGGVGRNIAERMSVDYQTGVSLITVVGDDENGKMLMEHMNSLGVDVTQSIVIKNKDANNNSSSNTSSSSGANTSSPSSTSLSSNANTTNNILTTLQSRYLTSPPSSSSSASTSISTANYLAIHHHDGDLYGGIADMSIFQYLSPDYILHSNCVGKLRNAALIVSDGNLLPDTFTELLKITSSYNIPVFFEPTSDVKCILPITTRTIHLIDVIKPNISELIMIISECLKQQQQQQQQSHQPPLIKQGIDSVQKALNNLQNQQRSGNSNSNDTNYDNLTDICILACALQNIMKSSSSSSSSSSFSLTTAEGRYRKVSGKHVIVTLGARGVIWVGPKVAVTRVRARESASNSTVNTAIAGGSCSRRSSGIVTAAAAVIVDDVTAMKIFPSIPIPQFNHHQTSPPHSSSSSSPITHTHPLSNTHSNTNNTTSANTHMNTNGAGDAFCAGVISSLLDPACDDLDTRCILQGLQAAANRIISTNQP